MNPTDFELAITLVIFALMIVIGGASHFLYRCVTDLYERVSAWYRYRDLKRRLQAMTKQAYTRRYK